MRVLEIARVVMEQLRTYPHGDVAGEFKATEFESALDLSIENWSRWMQTHALLQRGQAVSSQEICRPRGTIRANVIGLGCDPRGDVIGGDVAPEIHQARRDRVMSRVEHLDGFSRDFAAGKPFAVRKAGPNQVRENI